MKKVYVLMLAIVAMLAFASLSASSAFALTWEPAEFLVGGKPAEAGAKALAVGELLLEDKKLAAVLCSGELVGEFQSPTDLLVTKVLELTTGREIEVLKGTGLKCTAEKTCSEDADLEVFPEHLPWLLFPELDIQESTPWVLVFGTGLGGPAYAVECLILGVLTEETCTAVEGSGNEVFNVSGGVETAAGTVLNEEGNCTVGGEKVGVIEAETAGLLTSEAGIVSISTP